MGTKRGHFEESTKITSSSEIDEILKQARATHALVDDGEGDFGERTQIGNVQALAESMMIDEPPPPPPVIARASSSQNVIRRQTSPHVVPRTSESMPAIRANGSLSDITPLPPQPQPDWPAVQHRDDEAFDPWEEQPVKSISQPLPIVTLPPEPEPMQVSMMYEPVATQPPKRGVRWGVVAWCMLFAAMIGAGTVGFIRIHQLETELAQAKSALERAQAR